MVAPQPAPELPPNVSAVLQTKQIDGWSPSKLSSLSFFLKNTSLPALQKPVPAAPAAPSDNQRPYLGLKYLLRAGPSGAGAPSTWTQQQQSKGLALPAPPSAAAAAVTRQTGRYAPYTLQPPPKSYASG